MKVLLFALTAVFVDALPQAPPQIGGKGPVAPKGTAGAPKAPSSSATSAVGGPNPITFAMGGIAGLIGGASTGVPYGPVPKGCSAHEILVGMPLDPLFIMRAVLNLMLL